MKDFSNYYGTQNEHIVEGASFDFDRMLAGLEGKDVLFNSDTETTRALVQIHTNPLNQSIDNYKISVKNETKTINRGDLVKVDNEDYLLFTKPQRNQVYSYGEIRFCESKLNYIDKDTGLPYSVPCVKISKFGNDDYQENKYLKTVDGDATVYVQANEFTNKIKKRDGFRFIFSDEECYELMNVYKSIYSGLIVLSLNQSEINFETDKYVDLGDETYVWIADFTNAPTYSLSIKESDSDLINGNTLQLSAQVTKDGQVVSEEVVWSSSDENIATVDSSTGLVSSVALGSAVITCTMKNNSSVSDTVNVDVVNSVVDNFSYSVTPNNSGITLTDTTIFEVQGYNNGISIVETYTFSVDGSTTADGEDYEFVVIDDTSFSIKNVNDGKVVSVKIVPNSNVGAEFVKNFELRYFY